MVKQVKTVELVNDDGDTLVCNASQAGVFLNAGAGWAYASGETPAPQVEKTEPTPIPEGATLHEYPEAIALAVGTLGWVLAGGGALLGFVAMAEEVGFEPYQELESPPAAYDFSAHTAADLREFASVAGEQVAAGVSKLELVKLLTLRGFAGTFQIGGQAVVIPGPGA